MSETSLIAIRNEIPSQDVISPDIDEDVVRLEITLLDRS